MNFRQHIPNLITLGNLLCGCIALVAANSDIKLSVFFVLLAAILDFFDGLVARMLRVSSPLGKQLDSLADLVSFGLVPAYWLYLTLQPLLFSDSILFQHSVVVSTIELIIFCSVLAGAWRLARFNIDSTQNSFFRGLPIPANGLFWVSIMMSQDIFISIDNHSLIVLFLTLSVAISFLMVSTIRLLNLKFSSLGWKENNSRYLLVIASLVTGILIWVISGNFYLSFPFILFIYIIISIIHFNILKKA